MVTRGWNGKRREGQLERGAAASAAAAYNTWSDCQVIEGYDVFKWREEGHTAAAAAADEAVIWPLLCEQTKLDGIF